MLVLPGVDHTASRLDFVVWPGDLRLLEVGGLGFESSWRMFLVLRYQGSFSAVIFHPTCYLLCVFL